MTTADRMLFGSAENHASQQSLRGLDWLNLFLAGVLTGFGPFVALYLAGRSWTKVEIGLVLTVSGLTGLLIQVPGGELLDVVRSKRPLVALGVATIACAALILALWPSFTPVLIAEVLLGMTGGFLGPAVAAISLGLVGNDGLPERRGFSVAFFTAAGLVHQLMEARDERRLLKLQTQLAAVKPLIVDELGYVPLSQTGAELLFEIFSQRHERGSTIVTSNLPFEEWTSVFGSQRLTGALLARLTHHVHILELNGESDRLKQSKAWRRRDPRPADEAAATANPQTGEIASAS